MSYRKLLYLFVCGLLLAFLFTSSFGWSLTIHILQLHLGTVLGLVCGALLYYCLLLLLLPPPNPPESFSMGQCSAPLEPSPVTQVWAGVLPMQSLPYHPDTHSSKDTVSCRLTIFRHWMKVEYPAGNITPVARATDLLPSDLKFLEYYDKVNLTKATTQLLPEQLPVKEKFRRKWPVKVGEPGKLQFVLFARTGREKMDLWRALQDGADYVEDARNDLLRANRPCLCAEQEERRETQRERRASYKVYLQHCKEETDMEDWSPTVKFLNLVIHRMFFDLRDKECVRKFIQKKIVHKLGKINFLTKYFPNYTVEQINVGAFPPHFYGFRQPLLQRLGLVLPLKLQYHGLASIRIYLWPQSRFSFKLDLVGVEGHFCINVAQEPTDRVWVGFTQKPRIELRLDLLWKETLVTDWVILRVLQLVLDRLQKEIKKALVLPHMTDVPFRPKSN